MHWLRKYLILVLSGLILVSSHLFGQKERTQSVFPAFFKEIYRLPCPSGYEEAMVKQIQSILGKTGRFFRDNLGSLYFSSSQSSSQLAIISPLDEAGYVISGGERNGYLRVDRVTPAPHPFWDTFPAGHPVEILTSQGVVEGVWTVPSLHIFPRDRRSELNRPFSLEKAYIDVGAQSLEEIKAKGIQWLDPVVLKHQLVKLAGGQLAGPYLGGKACVASVLAVAKEDVSSSQRPQTEVIYAWLAQSKFFSRSFRQRTSLGAIQAARVLSSPQVIIVWPLPEGDPQLPSIELNHGPVLWSSSTQLKSEIEEVARSKNISWQNLSDFSSAFLWPFQQSGCEVAVLGLPVRFLDTPSEVIVPKDWQALTVLLQSLIHSGGRP